MRNNLLLIFVVGTVLAGCESVVPQKRPYYFRPLGNTPDIVEVSSSPTLPPEKTKKSGGSVCFERSPSQAGQQAGQQKSPLPTGTVLESNSRSVSKPPAEKTGRNPAPLQNGVQPKEKEEDVKIKSFLDS